MKQKQLKLTYSQKTLKENILLKMCCERFSAQLQEKRGILSLSLEGFNLSWKLTKVDKWAIIQKQQIEAQNVKTIENG